MLADATSDNSGNCTPLIYVSLGHSVPGRGQDREQMASRSALHMQER